MTTAELTQAQADLRLTNRELCKLLDVTEASLCNWKAGRVPVPGPVALAVRLLLEKNRLEMV